MNLKKIIFDIIEKNIQSTMKLKIKIIRIKNTEINEYQKETI